MILMSDNDFDYDDVYNGLTAMRRSLDPVCVMRDTGFDPDPWQAGVLRCESSRLLLLCARQMGKSLTSACKAIHRALYRDGSLVLLISRSQDQSDELFRKIIDLYNRLGRPVKANRELVSEIEFVNGSRIVALPNNPDTIRGYSDCSLLLIDEASRVPHAAIVATMPMIMASSGDIVLLSTPCGQQGFFYDRWVDPVGGWERITATASDCPRFDPDVLAQVRHDIGELASMQEFDCLFLASSDQVFSTQSI
jgi:hypothetical protein